MSGQQKPGAVPHNLTKAKPLPKKRSSKVVMPDWLPASVHDMARDGYTYLQQQFPARQGGPLKHIMFDGSTRDDIGDWGFPLTRTQTRAVLSMSNAAEASIVAAGIAILNHREMTEKAAEKPTRQEAVRLIRKHGITKIRKGKDRLKDLVEDVRTLIGPDKTATQGVEFEKLSRTPIWIYRPRAGPQAGFGSDQYELLREILWTIGGGDRFRLDPERVARTLFDYERRMDDHAVPEELRIGMVAWVYGPIDVPNKYWEKSKTGINTTMLRLMREPDRTWSYLNAGRVTRSLIDVNAHSHCFASVPEAMVLFFAKSAMREAGFSASSGFLTGVIESLGQIAEGNIKTGETPVSKAERTLRHRALQIISSTIKVDETFRNEIAEMLFPSHKETEF